VGEPDEDIKRRSDQVTTAASLVDLRLRHVSADLLILVPELELEIWPTVEPKMTLLDHYVAYDVTYEITAQDARGRRAVEARVTYTIIFEFEENDNLSSDDFAAFGAIGVLSVAHPYIRELLHNLTSRMGIPPLLLEVMPPEPSPLSR
jgi:preprotein translocase subunit SecB